MNDIANGENGIRQDNDVRIALLIGVTREFLNNPKCVLGTLWQIFKVSAF